MIGSPDKFPDFDLWVSSLPNQGANKGLGARVRHALKRGRVTSWESLFATDIRHLKNISTKSLEYLETELKKVGRVVVMGRVVVPAR